VGFAVAVAASAGALAIRLIATEQRGSVLFLLPLIGAWAYLGLAAPITLLTEILAALAALSGLVWMAERSTAGSSGLRRAADVLPLPAVGVAIALVAGLLIPPGELRVGIAALLLVAALALVAIVLAHLHPARERVASIL
jgi:predicted Abi (CAAX) family protease